MAVETVAYENLELWVREKIPHYNNAIETHEFTIQALVREVNNRITELDNTALAPGVSINRSEARKLIQLLGFMVSSVERHYQAAKAAPGEGLYQLGVVEDFLSRLAVIAEHPPRDSHYTYWLWNGQDIPLSFTGDPQEYFFNHAVVQTHLLHNDSISTIRPICGNDVPISSGQAVTAIEHVIGNVQSLYETYRSYMEYDASNGRRRMEPAFFMKRMRTYLPSYPVRGELWAGVNAANLAAQMQFDYLVGVVNVDYAKIVQRRFKYLTIEDSTNLQKDMGSPSLFDHLLEDLALSKEDVLSLDFPELLYQVNHAPAQLGPTLTAFKDLFRAIGRLTAIHWALIQNYLVKPAQALTPEEESVLPVNPMKGTGGMSHAETMDIMNMRRLHPVIAKLVEVINFRYGQLPLAK